MQYKRKQQLMARGVTDTVFSEPLLVEGERDGSKKYEEMVHEIYFPELFYAQNFAEMFCA